MYKEESMKKLHIWVDADACPVVAIVERIAGKYDIPVTLLCDTNHVLESAYSEVIVVGAGAEAETRGKGHQKMMNISVNHLRK